jgi:hypothetical protein
VIFIVEAGATVVVFCWVVFSNGEFVEMGSSKSVSTRFLIHDNECLLL